LPGVLPGVAGNVLLVAPGDTDAVAAALAADDVAAVILEPTGAAFGKVPVAAGHLAALRQLTRAHGTLLIFDEVVTGFRVAPGGAQARYGIAPDLTTLAKILAGGMPGGAVVGRRDVLELLDFEACARRGREKIQHQGTFNANPVSAAAGIATLDIVAESDACDRANAFAARLREALNRVLQAQAVPWAVYGGFSGFHVFTNPRRRRIAATTFDPFDYDFEELTTNPPGLTQRLRLAMAVNGVDITGKPSGIVSAAHDAADLARTVDAFAESLIMLRRDGDL